MDLLQSQQSIKEALLKIKTDASEMNLSKACQFLMTVNSIASSLKEAVEALEEKIVSFSDPKKAKGTENLVLGAGWKCQIVKKQTVSVVADHSDLVSTLAELSTEAQKVIKEKTSHSLDSKKYAELLPEEQEIVDTLLMVKPAKTTVKIVGPKA